MTEVETRNHGLQVEVSRLQAEVSRTEQQLKFAGDREAGLKAELDAARGKVHEARSVEERLSSAERGLKAQNVELQDEVRRMKDSAAQAKKDQVATLCQPNSHNYLWMCACSRAVFFNSLTTICVPNRLSLSPNRLAPHFHGSVSLLKCMYACVGRLD
jgi:hypothetical protein